jgi:crotonobetainyl-CoA:carnitine CoA-transferase CaiB-like acyl-CoA transferase
MADWQKIKTEYITTDTSYRKLADKYGIDQATISRKAKKEDWVSKRQHHVSRMQAKVQQAVENKKIDRATKLLDVSDLLLQKVRERVEALDALEMGSQEFRHLSATIKDLKEIQMIRSDADMREQEARIKNLQKQAEKEEHNDNTIVIQFAEGTEDYAK